MISRLPDYILKKFFQLFPELQPLENMGILNLSARYLKNYLSLKLGQLIGNDK